MIRLQRIPPKPENMNGCFYGWIHAAGREENPFFVERPSFFSIACASFAPMPFDQFFERQCALPDFTDESQLKLQSARLLIVGCGGLGALFAIQMAASGVRHLLLCDADVVEPSNLHRQPAFGMHDIGAYKAVALSAFLQRQYPWVEPEALPFRMTADMAEKWMKGVDMVVDCTDDMPTRFLISDTCFDLNVPLVYGAVHGLEGQIGLFCADKDRVHLRDVFPDPAAMLNLPTCATSGVAGPVAGGVSSRMATEAFKWIAGIGVPATALFIHMDWGTNTEHITRLRPHPQNPRRQQVKDVHDFEQTNTAEDAYSPSMETFVTNTFEVIATQVDESLANPEFEWVDIREKHEFNGFRLCDKHIPLGELPSRVDELSPKKIPVFYCYAGVRSRYALQYVAGLGKWKRAGHLSGGIFAYAEAVRPEVISGIVH